MMLDGLVTPDGELILYSAWIRMFRHPRGTSLGDDTRARARCAPPRSARAAVHSGPRGRTDGSRVQLRSAAGAYSEAWRQPYPRMSRALGI